jgi:hypothetical protein
MARCGLGDQNNGRSDYDCYLKWKQQAGQYEGNLLVQNKLIIGTATVYFSYFKSMQE